MPGAGGAAVATSLARLRGRDGLEAHDAVLFDGHVAEDQSGHAGVDDLQVDADAVVVGRQDATGTQSLVAYFIPATNPAVTITKLRQSLAQTLPDYMIPSSFVVMDAFPQTPNGKTDRLRLPPPSRNRPKLDNPFVSPHTPMEIELCAIWSAVLGIDELGIHDNFFELGGDSLRATRVIASVMEVFGADLPIKTFLKFPQ